MTGQTCRARRRNIVLLPIGGVHRAVIEALDYAGSLSKDVRAVYTIGDQERKTMDLKLVSELDR